MDRAAPAEFRESPLGRYVVGRTWAYFCAHDKLAGIVLWGRPSLADAEAVASIAPATTHPPMPRHAALADARRAEGLDPACHRPFAEYLKKHWAVLAATIARFAIVRPQGVAGAIAEGAFRIVPAPYQVKVFTSPENALEWLGCPEDAPLIEQLDEIAEGASGVSVTLNRLRALIDARVSRVTIEEAARQVGVGMRSLQRRLREEGTTFREELNAGRVRAAQHMMTEGDETLTEIAYAVGCASPGHLATLFRKHTGQSPASWRKHHRGGSEPPQGSARNTPSLKSS